MVFASTAALLAIADLNLLAMLRLFDSTAVPLGATTLLATGLLLATVFIAGFADSSDLASFSKDLVEVF